MSEAFKGCIWNCNQKLPANYVDCYLFTSYPFAEGGFTGSAFIGQATGKFMQDYCEFSDDYVEVPLFTIPGIFGIERLTGVQYWGYKSVLDDFLTFEDFLLTYEKPYIKEIKQLPEAPIIATKASYTQVAGDHYKSFTIQPFEFCYKNNLNNLQSEVISYVARYNRKWKDQKNQLIDLNKAIHTIQLLIETITNEQNPS